MAKSRFYFGDEKWQMVEKNNNNNKSTLGHPRDLIHGM